MGPGQSKLQRAWRKGQYEQLRPLLWQGHIEAALAHLQTLHPGPGCEPIEALEESLTYLENQPDWIGNYQQWQDADYPEGLGMPRAGSRRSDQSAPETTGDARAPGERHRRGGSACTSAQCPVGCCFCQKTGGCLAPHLWWNPTGNERASCFVLVDSGVYSQVLQAYDEDSGKNSRFTPI